MARLSYRRQSLPAADHPARDWLYLRFTLSYRDVEELLAERGVDVSYETVRRWVLKFRTGGRATAAGAAAPPELPVAPG